MYASAQHSFENRVTFNHVRLNPVLENFTTTTKDIMEIALAILVTLLIAAPIVGLIMGFQSFGDGDSFWGGFLWGAVCTFVYPIIFGILLLIAIGIISLLGTIWNWALTSS